MKYVKFRLFPNQSPPNDSKCTGIVIPGTDWLVWAGQDGDTFPAGPLTHQDMTAEEIAAVQPDALRRAAAQAEASNSADPSQTLLRAALLVSLDEINVLRGWIRDFVVQVAAAASLTDLKTRVAALPATPDRTRLQALAALNSKIDTE